jgi:hypothetical protein
MIGEEDTHLRDIIEDQDLDLGKDIEEGIIILN